MVQTREHAAGGRVSRSLRPSRRRVLAAARRRVGRAETVGDPPISASPVDQCAGLLDAFGAAGVVDDGREGASSLPVNGDHEMWADDFGCPVRIPVAGGFLT